MHGYAIEVVSSFELLANPQVLFYLFLGTLFGTVTAVIPGVGGLTALALMLPFTFSLDPTSAIAFLLATLAVTSTADTIPAILFGVPGTVTSMVTVLDGYPMAKRGEAGRAMGAAFASSVLGGVIGALLLVLIVPFVIPIIISATKAELLAFCILGLSMVAALSGGSMFKGLASAAVGILLAFIGQEFSTATLRWTFDTVYLWDGLNIIIVALGIYALPELADLAIQGKSIARDGSADSQMRGSWKGVKDAAKNFRLIFRSSTISTALGILPAVGPAVIPWIVYSLTIARTKGTAMFGRGDVRGVIASESSNNATVGGSLLPTIALGVPGSAPMALLLGGFLLHGIAPGPKMLGDNLDFTLMMVWIIVLANIIGGGIAFALAGQLARVVFVRSTILVPLILVVVFVGAVQATGEWGDIAILLLVGVLGWVMKRVRWSRSPMFLAFILAPLVEQYFVISTSIHGWEWVLRPIPAIVLIGTFLFLLGIGYRRYMSLRERRQNAPATFNIVWTIETWFAVFAFGFFATAFLSAMSWPSAAKLMPQLAALLGLVTSAGVLFSLWRRPEQIASTAPEKIQVVEIIPEESDMIYDVSTDFTGLDPKTIGLRGLRCLLLLMLFFGLSYLVGIIAATPLFLMIYLISHRESWKLAVPISVIFTCVMYLFFEYFLRLAWPVPALAF
jgi:putative tricarboxylic transport membrane protein